MEGPWTILELAELAAETLAAARPAVSPADAGTPSGSPRANGRVRDVPNERLVRWYVTVGLVDPPLSRRGRVARYGRRHLLQLVAVKRRQAEGRSLAEIQAELAGATDEALAAVARVPETRSAPDPLATTPARFWARQARQPGTAAAERAGQPAAAAAGVGQLDPAAAAGAVQAGAAAAERARQPVAARARGGQEVRGGALAEGALAPAGLVRGIRLAPGVTLLLEGAGREPGPDDVTAIANAAQPLLEELASWHLRAFEQGHPPDVPGPSPAVGQLAEESQT